MGVATSAVLPLRVWLYVAVLAGTAIAVLGLHTRSAVREDGVAAASEARRFLDHRDDRHSVRVLALGSSLLWAATPPDRYAAVPGVAWMRLTKSGGGIGHLQAVLDILDSHPPEVLVIDTNLLMAPSLSSVMDDMRVSSAAMMSDLTAPLMQHVGLYHPAAQRLSDQESAFPCTELAPGVIGKQLAALAAQQNAAPDVPAIDTALQARLTSLAQRGVRIVLLDVQRSTRFQLVLDATRQLWLQRWKATLPPGPPMRYLASPEIDDQRLYCDGRHMNAAGARRFEPWWTEQLQQLARER